MSVILHFHKTKKEKQTMSSGTNSQRPSFAMLGAFAGFIMDYLATFFTFNQVKYWLSHKDELKRKLNEVFYT